MAKPVVAISGLHGVGKSTYARALSRALGLRHVSAGAIFRSIAERRGVGMTGLIRLAERGPGIDELVDGRIKEEGKRGGVILDGTLAGWMAPDADIKIFLEAPEEVRIRRVAERDGLSYEEARRVTLLREASERRRFKRFYGIDIDDKSIYDVILDTNLLPIEANVEVLKETIKGHIGSRW